MHADPQPNDPGESQRVFLGWDRPALPAVADWLIDRFDRDHGDAWVVVPTARAGRRLEALLLERRPVLVPPHLVTPGAFLDAWTQSARPADAPRVANDLETCLAWVSVLRAFAGSDTPTPDAREAGHHRLAALVPAPPSPDDWPGWWSLAQRLVRLREQLASGLADFGDAAEQAAGSQARWAVLAALDDAALATLAQWMLTDRESARRAVIDDMSRPVWQAPVFLAALADQTPLQQAVFERCVSVTPLVFADASRADRFDRFGGLVRDAWTQPPVGLPIDSLRVVDRRGDEADAVAHAIADAADRWQAQHGRPLEERHITLALADESRGPAVIRAVRVAGGTARTAAGRPLNEAAPATLLHSLARLLKTRRLDALAELVRHPDLQAWLNGPGGTGFDSDIDWPTLLDEWATRTLRSELLAEWLEKPDLDAPGPGASPSRGESIAGLFRRVCSLIPSADQGQRPLSSWSPLIADALRTIYGPHDLNPERARDADTVQALETLAARLREQAELPDFPEANPTLDVAAAIGWTLARVAGERARDPATAGDLEAMGLLDAALDDTPVVVVASANDGFLPSTVNDDANGLLTDSLRTRLGVPDNDARFARDAYLLTATHRSRVSFAMVAARRGEDDEPLKPSRLWVRGASSADTAVRLLRFYDQPTPHRPSRTAPNTGPWLNAGPTNRFVIPRPQPDAPLPEKLGVTALRTYLACPYRFYLAHVLKLSPVHDAAVEMDAPAFGSLLHDALAAFGQSPAELRESTDPAVIAETLQTLLTRHARRAFGTDPRPAVRVQLAFAEERLEAYARLQADWNEQGWRIVHIEYTAAADFPVPAGTVRLEGRIDRIDHHPELGVRVIDFKTGDTPADPLRQHVRQRNGRHVWTDLQLPLYRDLIRRDATLAPFDASAVELGYVALPRKPEETDWRPLQADEGFWLQASEQRDAVLTGILTRDFRPGAPPDYPDAFSALCADDWPGRIDDLARWEILRNQGGTRRA
ncbi:MAG: PD-(D/E)XK nuclease family protein [Planctomycetota bacterium]